MDSTSLIFYTYIYLDPRKPGKYEYGDYLFSYEPFYVGKGKGNKHIGLKHTSESKKIISEKLKGKTAWNKGIPRTDEEKKKMSESGKVKIFTKEHRKNLSMALINRWKKKNLKFIKKES